VAEWYGAVLAIARSQVQICVPTQLSVQSLLGRLMSTSEKLGSKRAYHAMHWPRIRSLVTLAGVWLRATDTYTVHHGPLRLGN